MPRLKTRLAAQRWHLLVLALLLQWVSAVSRSRGARHDEPGKFTEAPTSGFLVIQDKRNLATLHGEETQSPTSERGADSSIADRTRAGLLALAVAVSAGIHIGLTPEHLQEMPRLGNSFIVAAVLGSAMAVALVSRPDDRRIAALAGLFCLGEILAWVLFVTIRVPLFPETPEPVETIALVSKAVEAVGWALALWILGQRQALRGATAHGACVGAHSS